MKPDSLTSLIMFSTSDLIISRPERNKKQLSITLLVRNPGDSG
jgi:hypothetical protein